MDLDKLALIGSNQCRYNHRPDGKRYYAICALIVDHEWMTDHMIHSNEIFTPRMVYQLLEAEYFQVEQVEECFYGWQITLRCYDIDPEERKRQWESK